ncbi:MAG: hypothetical protein H6704_21310 [Myxococcales bacterium]|nr:hypothetical protein [Myxococcales bacterium]MCB9538781.1 hypothetical protein [Myxococcales bacterium]
MRRWVSRGLLVLAMVAPAAGWAGPVEDARSLADEGKEILEKADKARANKKPLMLAEGLRKYARAYLLLTSRKLENDAPDLLQSISDAIKDTNALPEVAQMRRELLGKAIEAAETGKLTEAYDHLASLRDLDPREWTVEYALTVIGQRMEGG